MCISFLGLASQITTNWVVLTAEIQCFIILESVNLECDFRGLLPPKSLEENLLLASLLPSGVGGS